MAYIVRAQYMGLHSKWLYLLSHFAGRPWGRAFDCKNLHLVHFYRAKTSSPSPNSKAGGMNVIKLQNKRTIKLQTDQIVILPSTTSTLLESPKEKAVVSCKYSLG